MILSIGRRGLYGMRSPGFTRSPSRIGSWPADHEMWQHTTSKEGTLHESIVCDTVINGEATQSLTVLTTKQNCYEVDSKVGEVFILATTLSKSGKEEIQYGAWKDGERKVTAADVVDFNVRRPSTPEEDFHFQQSKMLQGQGIAVFQKASEINNRYVPNASNVDNLDNFKD